MHPPVISTLSPYLLLPGNCEKALHRYVECGLGNTIDIVRYGEYGIDAPSPELRGKVLHVTPSARRSTASACAGCSKRRGMPLNAVRGHRTRRLRPQLRLCAGNRCSTPGSVVDSAVALSRWPHHGTPGSRTLPQRCLSARRAALVTLHAARGGGVRNPQNSAAVTRGAGAHLVRSPRPRSHVSNSPAHWPSEGSPSPSPLPWAPCAKMCISAGTPALVSAR